MQSTTALLRKGARAPPGQRANVSLKYESMSPKYESMSLKYESMSLKYECRVPPPCSARARALPRDTALQGYLTHKKHPLRRTLQ